MESEVEDLLDAMETLIGEATGSAFETARKIMEIADDRLWVLEEFLAWFED